MSLTELYNQIVSLTYYEWLIILAISVSGRWLAGYLRHNKISLISHKKQKKLQSFNKKIDELFWTWWLPFVLIFAFLMWAYEYFVSLLN